MIQNIEEGTFSELANLEVGCLWKQLNPLNINLFQALDLSNNALNTIPLELFHLPLLRNLYVAYNNLANLEEDLLTLEKPIRAPLQILSLAECWLKRLPNFGILPDLWQLNISSNPMTDLTVDQFSPMCNLRSLDLNATHVPTCSCQLITSELSTRRTVIYNKHPNCFTGNSRIRHTISKILGFTNEFFFFFQNQSSANKNRLPLHRQLKRTSINSAWTSETPAN